jgi:hypothetical protein
MKLLVEALCSDRCAGRAAGTPGGRAARALVVEALRAAGLDPSEQLVPGCDGANVLATLPGNTNRWVVVAAHYDHLGTQDGAVYPGADDNAAAVAILVDVARALAHSRPSGRGILFAAFDAEEPPHFLTPAMGSNHFVAQPTVPLDAIDLMVCMDLVGHALGPEGLPAEVRNTVFALGSERSTGTSARVAALERATAGVIVRRTDAEIIPPLSDYAAFWQREIPFLFLTNARSRIYHTPDDVPAQLDYPKMSATARWLEGLVREVCVDPVRKVEFCAGVRDDASTLHTIIALASSLAEIAPQAVIGRTLAENLLAQCDENGRLPDSRQPDVQALVGLLESGLA